MLADLPWTSRQYEFAPRRKSTATTGDSSDGHLPKWSIPAEFRWGVTAPHLRTIWALHEACFPMTYETAYYRWLTSPECLGLVAYTTPEAMARLKARHRRRHGDNGANSEWETVETGGNDKGEEAEETDSDTDSVHEVSATIAAAEARTRGDFILAAPKQTMDEATLIVEIDQMVSELEHQHERDERKASEKRATTAAANSDTDKSMSASVAMQPSSSSSPFTEVIGFACGTVAYAKAANDRLFTNPTGYIGSLAVLPLARGLGLGGALVRDLLAYMTQTIPLRAASYLHYDVNDMKTIAWQVVQSSNGANGVRDAKASEECKRRANNTSSNSSSVYAVDDKEDGAPPGFWATAGRFFFPEAATWLDRRRLRQSLMADGMSRQAADAEIARRVALEMQDAAAETEEERQRDTFFIRMSAARRQELLDPVVQRGVREVWLHCMADDGPLRRFYQTGNGFRVAIERVAGFYAFGGISHDATLLRYERPTTVEIVTDTKAEEATAATTPANEYDEESVDLAAIAERRRLEREAELRCRDKVERVTQATAATAPVYEAKKAKSEAASGVRRRKTPEDMPSEMEHEGHVDDEEVNESEARDGKAKGSDADEDISEPTSSDDDRFANEANAQAQQASSSTLPTSQWLSSSTYGDVEDISLNDVATCRQHWRLQRDRRRAAMQRATQRQQRGGEGHRGIGQSPWLSMREIALTLNAVVCLLGVLYMLHKYGPV